MKSKEIIEEKRADMVRRIHSGVILCTLENFLKIFENPLRTKIEGELVPPLRWIVGELEKEYQRTGLTGSKEYLFGSKRTPEYQFKREEFKESIKFIWKTKKGIKYNLFIKPKVNELNQHLLIVERLEVNTNKNLKEQHITRLETICNMWKIPLNFVA